MMRVALCIAAFFGLANSMRAEDQLSYHFTTAATSPGTERSATILFDVSPGDDGSYSAVYSHRDSINETLTDVKAVAFERRRVLTVAEAGAFFASLADAGLWQLPEGDKFVGDGPNTQLIATVSGRDLQRDYHSPIKGGARETFHAAVTASAKKLGIDQPEDVAKATKVIEGDRTPAREIPFSALITNPARYDGRRVAVVAFYHSEFECSMLVSQKFAWKGLDSDRQFWLYESSKFAQESEVRRKNDSWARVEGVFSARHGGHLGFCPGFIDRVTKFTPLDGPPPPPAAGAVSEDDPHGLEKLDLEIQIQPFPMDGRPIQEVVAALNRQISAQLAERGLAEDWLKIDLDPISNPKARVKKQAEKTESLRTVVKMLGLRVSPGEEDPFGEDLSTYMYVLPNVIRLCMRKSPYPDDKESVVWREDTFGKQAVRVKLVRYAPKFGNGPDTFLVEWRSDMKPEDLRISEALDIIHRILPDEPGAKSITGIDAHRVDKTWHWTARTAASAAAAYAPDQAPSIEAQSPASIFAGRRYNAFLDTKTVQATPQWTLTGAPPVELEASIRAAREALREIPNAEDTLPLERIRLALLDDHHCAYQMTFYAPAAKKQGMLLIPVLLSGQAIVPKPQPDQKNKE